MRRKKDKAIMDVFGLNSYSKNVCSHYGSALSSDVAPFTEAQVSTRNLSSKVEGHE